jgi:hypothetical protein
MTKHCTKPCPDCPFSRKVAPGALGGSPVEVYVGQAHGPFVLACHDAKGYDPATVTPDSPQCAGAAIFRANIGVDRRMPSGIHRLPADHEAVFADEAEFIAHHIERPVDLVYDLLTELPPAELLRREVARLRRSANGRTFPLT